MWIVYDLCCTLYLERTQGVMLLVVTLQRHCELFIEAAIFY